MCEALERLPWNIWTCSVIDLQVNAHREVVRTMNTLINKGRFLLRTAMGAAEIMEAHDRARSLEGPAVEQPEYNI